MVLMSTPARSRWTAVVCRIVSGLTRFAVIDGTVLLACSAYCVTSRWMPNRVNGWLLRLKKTGSLLSRLTIILDSDVAVTGHNGQVRNLFALPCSRTDDCAPSCRLPMVSLAASLARAPLLYKNKSRA